MNSGAWLVEFAESRRRVDGLIPVQGFTKENADPEVVSVMEKAKEYGADAVFFEAGRNDRRDIAQALIFISAGPEDNDAFAEVHQRLWSWGGVLLPIEFSRASCGS